jgi:hypothetical protein
MQPNIHGGLGMVVMVKMRNIGSALLLGALGLSMIGCGADLSDNPVDGDPAVETESAALTVGHLELHFYEGGWQSFTCTRGQNIVLYAGTVNQVLNGCATRVWLVNHGGASKCFSPMTSSRAFYPDGWGQVGVSYNLNPC